MVLRMCKETLTEKLGIRKVIEPSPTGILGDVNRTWIFQWLLSVWKNFGWSSIIYIAAIVGMIITCTK